MLLFEFPDDIQHHILQFLQNHDFGNMRLVKKHLKWKTKHLMFNRHIILDVLNLQSQNMFRRCCVCPHEAITHIQWSDGNKRQWIPWCSEHTPGKILDNVECYCVGEMDAS